MPIHAAPEGYRDFHERPVDWPVAHVRLLARSRTGLDAMRAVAEQLDFSPYR